MNDTTTYDCYKKIEAVRENLLADKTMIDVEDFGAGSAVIKTNSRAVNKMAASSLKSKKYAQLLFRIVQYYKPKQIVELGTSFGISSSYMACGNKESELHTFEGAPSIAFIAKENFSSLGLKNIKIHEGDFNKTVSPVLEILNKIDLAFVDGNHRKEPTLQYFHKLLTHASPSTILIFDDIHWSEEMEDAWQQIQQHPEVTLTIDLFFIGLAFINPDFKVKQQFQIRF